MLNRWCIAVVRKIFAYEMHIENIGQYMQSKQLPFIEKFICLAAMQSVSLV